MATAVDTCPKGVGKRDVVHDWPTSVFHVMLENDGFLNVQLEDAWWDVGVAYANVDHHWSDITCEHPKTHAKYVFDLVVWWGAIQGLDEWGGCSRVVEGVAILPSTHPSTRAASQMRVSMVHRFFYLALTRVEIPPRAPAVGVSGTF